MRRFQATKSKSAEDLGPRRSGTPWFAKTVQLFALLVSNAIDGCCRAVTQPGHVEVRCSFGLRLEAPWSVKIGKRGTHMRVTSTASFVSKCHSDTYVAIAEVTHSEHSTQHLTTDST